MKWLRMIAATLAVLLSTTTLAAVPAHADSAHPTRDGARYLATCLQTAKTLNVLVLLDRSGSLANTDPEGQRYEGLRTAFASLAQRSGADDRPIAVQVAVAAFDQDYAKAKSIAGWTRINGDDSERAIDRLMERTRRDTFNPNGATNFQAALNGAVKEFDGRTGAGACNALLWFTDGEFAVGKNVDVAPLREEMCRVDGIVDQIRAKGIVIIGVQLGEDDLDLKPMSLGEGSGQTCGTVPFPEVYPPGIYLRADEPGTLRRVLGGIGTLTDGCSDAGSSGLIDPGIRRMIVLVPTDKKATKVRFRTPEGANLDVAAEGGSSSLGYTTSGMADEGLATIKVSFPPGQGTGQWQVSADQKVRQDELSFLVCADLALAKESNQAVSAKPGAKVTARIVDRDGRPATLEDFQKVVASAAVVGAGGSPRTAVASVEEEGVIAVTFDADPTDARVDVDVTVAYETQSGVELTPLSLKFGQQLMLSEDYPSVSPADVLDLGTAIKRGSTQAEFTLRGSPKGETKVCFDAVTDLVLPPEAQGTTLGYEQGCIDLAVNETKQLLVSMEPISAAVGDASARVPVQLHPIASSADAGLASMEIPVRWRFEDPLNPWAVVITTIIIALISALVPIAALLFANWLAARYSIKGLRYRTVLVGITEGGVETPERLTTSQLTYLSAANPHPRQFELDGLTFRSKTSLNPSTAPKFWVEPPAGMALLTSPGTAEAAPDGSRSPVAPGLGLLVVVRADAARLASSDAQVGGHLTVVTAEEGLAQRQLDDVIHGLDLAALRERLAEGPSQSATGPAPDSAADAHNDDIWDD